MPTALNVDAVTPPSVMKNDKSGNEITPAATTAKKPKATKKKDQPSIMTFFKQPSSKYLFSKSDSPKDKSTTMKQSRASTESGSDKKSIPTITKPAPSYKPAAEPKTSSSSQKPLSTVPTEEEIREIVLGTSSTNLDDIVVPEPMQVDRGDDDGGDSLLPTITMRNPGLKRRSKAKPPPDSPARESDAESVISNKEDWLELDEEKAVEESSIAASKEEERLEESDNTPAKETGEDKSVAETAGGPSQKKEKSITDHVGVDHEEPLDDHDSDNQEDQSDDDTVDMSPLKQTLQNMANREDITEETTLETEDSTEDEPMEVAEAEDEPMEVAEAEQDEIGKADLRVECLDLTEDDSPTAGTPVPGTPKPGAGVKKTPSKKQASKPSPSKLADSKPAAADVAISAERQAALAKNETLRTQYQARLEGLIQKVHEGVEEETFQLPAPPQVETLPGEGTTVPSPLEFPECAIRHLALLVQESRFSLSDLAASSIIQLKESFPEGMEFHEDGVAAKIKLLATRESYMQISNERIANHFEDDNADRMWRWEIVSLDLLPDECTAKVKKARKARKKLRNHSKALCTLLKHLDQADKHLQDSKTSQAKCDDASAKITIAEEKVLKYEREEEKARLANEAKKHKSAANVAVAERKKTEKARAAEQKKKEKEEKKQAAAKEREDKKREKEEEKKKAEVEKEKKIKKQRTMMESFFTRPVSKARKVEPSIAESEQKPAASPSPPSVDSDRFWSRVNASDKPTKGLLFPTLSSKALASRKRRTCLVPVQVFVTLMPPDSAFDAQPYAELQTIHVRNKYKFLSFCEDCRPPYYGTWSKSSSLVTGRNPTGKDSTYLDYEVDSEAEWEEGDDELGEDCESQGPDEEDNIEDEEGDTRMYNYEDGWLAADDELDDDVDEDTKLLRIKKLKQNSSLKKALADQATICIIAPGKGGIPSDDVVDNLDDEIERIEGVNPSVARDLLIEHTGTVLGSTGPCLDAFPPPLVDEGNLHVSSSDDGSGNAKTSSSNEMSRSDLITFVEFVHHSEFPSKDRLVEELRTAHKTITSSRAQATRKLDCISEKKRYPGGVYWEVHREVLEELGLEDLLRKQFQLPPPPKSEKKVAKKPKASTSETPGSATGSKKEKDSPSATPASAQSKAVSSTEKSSKKKRPAPAVSQASVKLFAGYLKKKPKTQE